MWFPENFAGDSHRPTILHYALGGGLGHLFRQIGLAREIQRLSAVRSIVLTNSEFVETAVQAIRYDANLGIGSAPSRTESHCAAPAICSLRTNAKPLDAQRAMQCIIQQPRPAGMIVDVFPRGICGELVPIIKRLTCPKILVSRQLPLAYCQEFQLDSFVREQFELVLRIENQAPFQSHSKAIEAIPIINLPSARGISNTKPQSNGKRILIVGCGSRTEINEWKSIVHELNSKLKGSKKEEGEWDIQFQEPDSNWEHDSSYDWNNTLSTPAASSINAVDWPLANRLSEFDLIIGNAGYNLHWECQVAGVPSLLFARPRKYDDQTSRTPRRWPITVDKLWQLIQSKLEGPRVVNRKPDGISTMPPRNQIEFAAKQIVDLIDT